MRGELYQFVEGNLDATPPLRGIYELLIDAEVIYLAQADRSLQASLRAAWDALEGDPANWPTTFRFEVLRRPWLALDRELASYRSSHSGELPRLNARGVDFDHPS